jgi:phosphoribosylanthranilate isomerase
MFRIKICGITNVEDAIAAVDAGADAIGLNFYELGARFVTVPLARRISDAIVDRVNDLIEEDTRRELVYSVGVFVNHSAECVRQTFRDARLAVVQLHGDESPAILNDLPEIPAIRVRRLGSGGLAAIAEDLAACKRIVSGNAALNVVSPCALLLDAMEKGQFGGTGKTLPWAELADHRRWLGDTPLILAGGLTPDNVAEAIRIVRPYGVDVASGVESAPGKKDPVKVRDFIAAARAALDALPN